MGIYIKIHTHNTLGGSSYWAQVGSGLTGIRPQCHQTFHFWGAMFACSLHPAGVGAAGVGQSAQARPPVAPMLAPHFPASPSVRWGAAVSPTTECDCFHKVLTPGRAHGEGHIDVSI